MNAFFKDHFQGYNGLELLTWLAITGLGAWGFIYLPHPIAHVAMFLVILVFGNLTMGNIMYPRPQGYIFGAIKRWWKLYSTPATLGTFKGRPILERSWDKFYIELFDASGHRFGVKQHYFDFGEYRETYQGEPELQFSRTLAYEKYRLSRLARLRSPKLPKPQAEVLAADGDVVGYTEYKML